MKAKFVVLGLGMEFRKGVILTKKVQFDNKELLEDIGRLINKKYKVYRDRVIKK